MTPTAQNPVRVAVLEQHELLAAGLTAMLKRFAHRVSIMERPGPEVEVVLYGVREDLEGAHDKDLHRLLRDFRGVVIALGWFCDDPGVQLALNCGAHGFLSKTLSSEALISGVEQHLRRAQGGTPSPAAEGHCHPGVEVAGLTPRERDAVSLVAVGLTNREIAERLSLSINSVKTYLGTGYRKIGVTRRSQVVVWAERHGLVDTLPTARPPDPGQAVDSKASLYLLPRHGR